MTNSKRNQKLLFWVFLKGDTNALFLKLGFVHSQRFKDSVKSVYAIYVVKLIFLFTKIHRE